MCHNWTRKSSKMLLLQHMFVAKWWATLFQVSLETPWTNIFAIMRVYRTTQKLCTTVTREPSGHCPLKTRLCTWTSMHMEGQLNYTHTHTRSSFMDTLLLSFNSISYYLNLYHLFVFSIFYAVVNKCCKTCIDVRSMWSTFQIKVV